MASSTGGESGEGLAKAKRPQSQGVPLLVLSDEPSTQSQGQQRAQSSDVREGQFHPQIDKPSHEAVLEDMITDSPMVSPVQSIRPSPVRKLTPVTGVQSGGKAGTASASSGSGNVKSGQSGNSRDIIDLEGAVNIVSLKDIEQHMEVDEQVDPNDYRAPRIESLSDGEEQPPEHDSNDEEYDDDPDFWFGFIKRSTVVPGTIEYHQTQKV